MTWVMKAVVSGGAAAWMVDATGADKTSGLTPHVGVDIQVVHLEIGRLLAGDELELDPLGSRGRTGDIVGG